MNKLTSLLMSDKFRGVIAIAAAVVMYFTPDSADKIIESFLGAFGISTLMLKNKE